VQKPAMTSLFDTQAKTTYNSFTNDAVFIACVATFKDSINHSKRGQDNEMAEAFIVGRTFAPPIDRGICLLPPLFQWLPE
jgi:hypothetical protein